MNIYNNLLNLVKNTLMTIRPATSDMDLSKIVVEPSKNADHGHVATNAALVMAKALSENPRSLGEGLRDALLGCDTAAYDPLLIAGCIKDVTLAGPGFINITLSDDFWHDQLKHMLKAGDAYGKPSPDLLEKASKEPVLVEYVSVNPTGPLHAGHGRNAILGDTIASLLAFYGHPVTREYYINDAGGQVDALSRSVYLRYCEALGRTLSLDDFTKDMYGGDYLIPAGVHMAKEYGDRFLDQPEHLWLDLFKEESVALMMDGIRSDLKAAGIVMDVYTSEKALAQAGAIDRMLESLCKSDDAYVGVLAPPRGIVVEDWEEKPQTLFKAVQYGDDVDRPLKKSNGGWTYFAGDAAYHYDKYHRGFSQMINVFGADHAGYLKRLKAVVQAITKGNAHLEIKVTQMVNFMDHGTPIRMSKRAGTFITFRDVIEKVGIDATRYMMVSRHQDTALDFDFSLVIAQTKDNPIFYINYAHARIHSVLRHMMSLDPAFSVDLLLDTPLHTLTDPAERSMIEALATWPRTIDMAVTYREPHRVANGLYDLASAFHGLWSKGKENTSLRFIDPHHLDRTYARLALIHKVASVIRSGLKILGIDAIDEMRQDPKD